MWTQFWDMNSGGGRKEQWDKIYIEADKDEAKVIFFNRFGHNPDRVTCTCCGEDYTIESHISLDELTRFHRTSLARVRKMSIRGEYSAWNDDIDPVTPEEYKASDGVLVIPWREVKPEERKGDVPPQGYVWVG